MAEQVVNPILTTLAAAITDPAATTGIQVNLIPTAITGTMRLLFNGNGAEVLAFTGTTGGGPYTLTGVTRGVEGTASTYATGTQCVCGAITAGSILALNTNYLSAPGNVVSVPNGTNGIFVYSGSVSATIGAVKISNIGQAATYNGSSQSLIPHRVSLHISADQQFPAVYLDAFDSTGTNLVRPIVNGRAAGGTCNAPAGTISGQVLLRLSGRAFTSDTSAWTGSLAAIDFATDEATSSTNQGAGIDFRTTPTGSTGGGTLALPGRKGRMFASGGFALYANESPTADPGNSNMSISSLTLRAGWIGSTTNDNAAAGYVGEYVTSSVAIGSNVSLTTTVTATVTSISLTAGDWDVTGQVDYHYSSSTAASPNRQGISTTVATLGAQDTYSTLLYSPTYFTTGLDAGFAVPTVRLSLSATTTVYLVANAAINVGTAAAYGTIRARRAR